MIRRLPHKGLLESITPRAVRGGCAPVTTMESAPTVVDDLDTQAYRQGYAEGFQAGEEDGRREAEQYQQAWEEQTRHGMEETRQALQEDYEQLAHFADGLHEQLRALGETMAQQAFELALKSLSRAFGSMHADGELLRRLCQELVEDYRGKVVQVEVSAADRAFLPEQIDGLDVVIEHALSTGECRIVTERGYVESSIAMRLDAIHGAMLDALGVGRP